MANKKKSEGISGIRERTHKSVDAVMDKAESIGESGNDAMNQLKEKAFSMKKNVDSYIRQNPEKSVLIAAGAGAIAGILLAAAMMRRNR